MTETSNQGRRGRTGETAWQPDKKSKTKQQSEIWFLNKAQTNALSPPLFFFDRGELIFVLFHFVCLLWLFFFSFLQGLFCIFLYCWNTAYDKITPWKYAYIQTRLKLTLEASKIKMGHATHYATLYHFIFLRTIHLFLSLPNHQTAYSTLTKKCSPIRAIGMPHCKTCTVESTAACTEGKCTTADSVWGNIQIQNQEDSWQHQNRLHTVILVSKKINEI